MDSSSNNSSNSTQAEEEVQMFLPLWLQSGLTISSCIFCPIGLVSSLLTLCSLWTKMRTEHNSFYNLMFTVSSLDILYHIAFLTYSCNQDETWPHLISLAIAFSVSLASDMCALILTIERYSALKWPHRGLSTSKTRKTMINMAIGSTIIVISSLRMYYIFDDAGIVQKRLPSAVLDYWFSNRIYVQIGIDIVLPFVLVICMAAFSVLTLSIVINRQKKKKTNVVHPVMTIQVSPSGYPSHHNQNSSHAGGGGRSQMPVIDLDRLTVSVGATTCNKAMEHTRRMNKEKADQVVSTISLVLLLDAFFMVNQLGYCLCTSIQISKGENFDTVFFVALFVSFLAENLSHTFNFFFYIKFSRMIRMEFYDFFKRVRAWVKARV